MKGGSYGEGAAFGASFLFARILEGPLSLAFWISAAHCRRVSVYRRPGIDARGWNYRSAYFVPARAITGSRAGRPRRFGHYYDPQIYDQRGESTFGADVMMGAGNAAGRTWGRSSSYRPSWPRFRSGSARRSAQDFLLLSKSRLPAARLLSPWFWARYSPLLRFVTSAHEGCVFIEPDVSPMNGQQFAGGEAGRMSA